MQPRRTAADWRDAASYAALLDADRPLLAWEWLRRDPGYAAAAHAALGGRGGATAVSPRSWGLEAFENPDRTAPDARPVWTRDIHAAVLAVIAAESAAGADSFDLNSLVQLSTLLPDRAGGEHLLLSDGLRAIRIDILAGTVGCGPVRLRYQFGGLAGAEPPLLALRRLIHLCRTGRFSRSLHAREPRTRRRLLTLRAYDALAAGADQREIAAVLLAPGARGPRWRSEAPSLRSRAQRLVRGTRRMATGGYRALLR
jgi:hypothetical protein